jgi:hypothetical protein
LRNHQNNRCKATARHDEFLIRQPNGDEWLEHFIVLTIPSGDVQTEMGVHTDLWVLQLASFLLGAVPVARWIIQDYEEFPAGDHALTEREWRIIVPTRLVGIVTKTIPFVGDVVVYIGPYRDMWLNHPGDMVYLMDEAHG